MRVDSKNVDSQYLQDCFRGNHKPFFLRWKIDAIWMGQKPIDTQSTGNISVYYPDNNIGFDHGNKVGRIYLSAIAPFPTPS